VRNDHYKFHKVVSAETLFRRGAKRLHRFAANLLGKRSAEFHQNLRFIKILQKKDFGLFFPDTLYIIILYSTALTCRLKRNQKEVIGPS